VSDRSYSHAVKDPLPDRLRSKSARAGVIGLGCVGLPLGNLDARRDWGFAGDYVRATWMNLP